MRIFKERSSALESQHIHALNGALNRSPQAIAMIQKIPWPDRSACIDCVMTSESFSYENLLKQHSNNNLSHKQSGVIIPSNAFDIFPNENRAAVTAYLTVTYWDESEMKVGYLTTERSRSFVAPLNLNRSQISINEKKTLFSANFFQNEKKNMRKTHSK